MPILKTFRTISEYSGQGRVPQGWGLIFQEVQISLQIQAPEWFRLEGYQIVKQGIASSAFIITKGWYAFSAAELGWDEIN